MVFFVSGEVLSLGGSSWVSYSLLAFADLSVSGIPMNYGPLVFRSFVILVAQCFCSVCLHSSQKVYFKKACCWLVTFLGKYLEGQHYFDGG